MMVMYSPKLCIYLEEITRYTIVAWMFANENKWWRTHLLHVTTNILYHYTTTSLYWLSPKAQTMWNVCKSIARWWKILQHGWHSHLSFRTNVHIHMESYD